MIKNSMIWILNIIVHGEKMICGKCGKMLEQRETSNRVYEDMIFCDKHYDEWCKDQENK